MCITSMTTGINSFSLNVSFQYPLKLLENLRIKTLRKPQETFGKEWIKENNLLLIYIKTEAG